MWYPYRMDSAGRGAAPGPRDYATHSYQWSDGCLDGVPGSLRGLLPPSPPARPTRGAHLPPADVDEFGEHIDEGEGQPPPAVPRVATPTRHRAGRYHPPYPPELAARVRELYLRGMSARRAAAEVGVSPSAARKWLLAAGVVLRTRSQAARLRDTPVRGGAPGEDPPWRW